jgi:hypothetical protein
LNYASHKDRRCKMLEEVRHGERLCIYTSLELLYAQGYTHNQICEQVSHPFPPPTQTTYISARRSTEDPFVDSDDETLTAERSLTSLQSKPDGNTSSEQNTMPRPLQKELDEFLAEWKLDIVVRQVAPDMPEMSRAEVKAMVRGLTKLFGLEDLFT